MSIVASARPPLPLAVELRRRGISQRALAERLHIGEGHLSAVIHGRTAPSPLLRSACAMALGVDEAELFEEER